MSPIMSNSVRPAEPMDRIIWRCSPFSGEPRRMSDRPMIAFSGVRTSWLMVARNSPLAALARSAMALASCSRLISEATYSGSTISELSRPAASRICSRQNPVVATTTANNRMASQAARYRYLTPNRKP